MGQDLCSPTVYVRRGWDEMCHCLCEEGVGRDLCSPTVYVRREWDEIYVVPLSM